MFERFTERARQVVVLAQEEARTLQHPVINSAHLLLGLFAAQEGIAARALGRCGLTPEAVRERVRVLEMPDTPVPSGHIPFTTSAKKVLEHSLRASLALGVTYIGSEHVLLGLLRVDAAGAHILSATVPGGLGQVRSTTLTLITERAGSAEELREVQSTGRAAGPDNSATRLRGLLRGETARTLGAENFRGLMHAPRRPDDPVAPRPELFDPLVAVLGRPQGNKALLIGPSGAGKSALARALRQAVARRTGRLGALEGATLLELSLSALRTGPDRLVRRANRPVVVLVEDLDGLFAAYGPDRANLLAAALLGLADLDVPLIATGTEDARRRLAQVAPALLGRFELVPVPAADAALTVEILRVLRPELSAYHGVSIDDAILDAAVRLAAERAASAEDRRVLPGAAVDLLEDAAARAAFGRSAGWVAEVRTEHLRAADAG